MLRLISLFLLPLLLFTEELEIHLATRSNLKPIYLSQFDDEIRSILAFDINTNGYATILSPREDLEKSLSSNIDLALWKREKIPLCIVGKIENDRLLLTVYDTQKGSSKKFSASTDRHEIHKLADALQKDLFGKEGIASQKIIYTKRTKTGTEKGHSFISEVWIADADGKNERQLTYENSYCLSPSFYGINGDQFIYVSEKSGQSKIYLCSLNGKKNEIIVDLRGNQALPALSKKGEKIAFITDVAGRPDLFIQNLNAQGLSAGKARQLFSAPRATQATPTFSPDGKQIAFVSDKDGPPRVYLMNLNAETQKPRLLTKKNRENTSPSWSPDGTKLAYSAKVDGIRQIWIYDFINDEEMQLTQGNENKENPSWAPDSLHLVYNTESDDKSELFLISLNEPNPVQITRGSGQKRFASWQMR